MGNLKLRAPNWRVVGNYSATLVAASALCACVTFVSSYDDIFDQQATSTQKEIDSFFQKLSEDNGKPAGTYESNISGYGKIEVDLNSLLVRASAHDKNEQTIDQIKHVQATFEGAKALHKSQGHLSLPFDSIERKTINEEFTAMEKLELLKKRGQK